MTYQSGPITNANPGPTLYAALETALVAAGFVAVDTVVIDSTTYKVLRSPAASNAVNKDWYLVIGFQTTGTNSVPFTMRAFEGYDAATDLGYRGPVGWYGTPPGADWSPTGTDGYPLNDSHWDSSVAMYYPSTTTFTYYFSATPDRVILSTSRESSALYYVGLYEPYSYWSSQAGSENFPLVTIKMESSGGNYSSGAITRIPLIGVDPNEFLERRSLYQAWTVLAGVAAEEYDAILKPFPTTSATFGTHLAWDVEIVQYLIGPIGRLRDVKVTRGNTSSGLVQGDTAKITTNADLTGGDDYLCTQRNNNVYMFRTI